VGEKGREFLAVVCDRAQGHGRHMRQAKGLIDWSDQVRKTVVWCKSNNQNSVKDGGDGAESQSMAGSIRFQPNRICVWAWLASNCIRACSREGGNRTFVCRTSQVVRMTRHISTMSRRGCVGHCLQHGSACCLQSLLLEMVITGELAPLSQPRFE